MAENFLTTVNFLFFKVLNEKQTCARFITCVIYVCLNRKWSSHSPFLQLRSSSPSRQSFRPLQITDIGRQCPSRHLYSSILHMSVTYVNQIIHFIQTSQFAHSIASVYGFKKNLLEVRVGAHLKFQGLGFTMLAA